MGKRSAYIMKTYLLAMIYGPGIPMAYPITALSLFAEYWVHKYCLLRRHSMPERIGDKLNRTMMFFIPIGILLNTLTNLIIHYFYNPDSLNA